MTTTSTMTADDRITKIDIAVEGLDSLIASAHIATLTHGPESIQAHAAWERVEQRGATIHRQARRLAGKKRGG